MSIQSLMDKDDRDYERKLKRESDQLPDETLRKHNWTPPTPEEMAAFYGKKKKRKKR